MALPTDRRLHLRPCRFRPAGATGGQARDRGRPAGDRRTGRCRRDDAAVETVQLRRSPTGCAHLTGRSTDCRRVDRPQSTPGQQHHGDPAVDHRQSGSIISRKRP
uniref:Uncharacterized protein n=1 Tax=Pseudomonas fluorescens TaxID=294 RepID=Q51757_PSEFL|nr:unknown [Pseudomonas fluorescens]